MNFSGFYCFFILQLSLNHREMRERIKTLPPEQLEKMTFRVDEFEKVKVDDHEIRVNGKMYDIARVEKTEDLIIVYALHDENEDDLLALLGFFLSSPVDKKEMPPQIGEFLSLIFIPEECRLSLAIEKRETPFTRYLSSFQNVDTRKDSPPPRTV